MNSLTSSGTTGALLMQVDSIPALDERVVQFLGRQEDLERLSACEWRIFVKTIVNGIVNCDQDVRDKEGYDLVCSVLTERFPLLKNFCDPLRSKLRTCFKRLRWNNRVTQEEAHVEENEGRQSIGTGDPGDPDAANPSVRLGQDNFEYEDELRICKNRNLQDAENGDEEEVIEKEDLQNQENPKQAQELDEIERNLINLEISTGGLDSVGDESLSNFSYLHRVFRSARTVPTNAFPGYERTEELKTKYLAKNGPPDNEIIALFRQTFEHRTTTAWTQDAFVLIYMYPCLKSVQLIEMEAAMIYGPRAFLQMNENVASLLRAVETYHSHLNTPYSLRYFFSKLNGSSDYIKFFDNPCDFIRFNPMLTDERPHLCILFNGTEIWEIKLLAFRLKIVVPSIQIGLLVQILLHDLFRKPFPALRKVEFGVLDSFVFGLLPKTLPHKTLLYLSEITAVFPELDTIESNSGQMSLLTGSVDRSWQE